MIEPTFPNAAPLYFVGQEFTIDAWTPQVSQLTLDLGNKVYLRPGQGDSGFVHACIPNRLPKLTLDPEASLVADYDLWGLWRSMTEAATITWKCQAGDDSAVFAATKFQAVQITRGAREGVLVDQLEGQLNADDLSIVFATGS